MREANKSTTMPTITRDLTFPGKTRFLTFYEQLFYNASPLLLFEENKPAWSAPTTITRWWRLGQTRLDPKKGSRELHKFVGSVAALLREALKTTALSQALKTATAKADEPQALFSISIRARKDE